MRIHYGIIDIFRSFDLDSFFVYPQINYFPKSYNLRKIFQFFNISPRHTIFIDDSIDEIIEATRSFREVVLTCRTQYFPGQEDDPYELKIQRPDQNGYYILNKLYISPFDDEEIEHYLKKKYPARK